ncbi:uncharacterized protein LOC130725225 [Lotus japonicus]|uniref:uncharacterized protein LOC130725225 n=1 Tax=Lotus japonicus TaxID=34305 RepID=UPI00258C901D|nr:uncharacterized protein LOC130725225 [Lotus japonicus]
MCPFFTNIRGFVSNKCLQLLDAEHIRMKSYGRCDCLLRETHGLPCGCELAGYERIPYEAIHPFWKRLSWEHVPEPVADTISNHICGMNHGDMQPEVEALTHYFSSLDTGGQSMVRRKLQAIYCPESSSLCTPEVQIRSKRTLKANERKPPKVKAIGSLTRDPSGFEHVDREIKEAKKASQPPKKKKRVKKSDTSYFMGHFPSFFHPYIHTVQNVEDDGNCGYRAIAALLGLPSGEEGWSWEENLAAKDKEIADLRERLAAKGKLLAEAQSDLESKCKLLAEKDAQAIALEEQIRREAAFATANERICGFLICKAKVKHLHPNVDIEPLGVFKKVTPTGLVGREDPPEVALVDLGDAVE